MYICIFQNLLNLDKIWAFANKGEFISYKYRTIQAYKYFLQRQKNNFKKQNVIYAMYHNFMSHSNCMLQEQITDGRKRTVANIMLMNYVNLN